MTANGFAMLSSEEARNLYGLESKKEKTLIKEKNTICGK